MYRRRTRRSHAKGTGFRPGLVGFLQRPCPGRLLNHRKARQEVDLDRDRRRRKRVIVYRSELPDTGELREIEYSAISEALHFACRDLREGRRRPIEIAEDGVVVHDASAIARACEERWAEEDITSRIADESS